MLLSWISRRSRTPSYHLDMHCRSLWAHGSCFFLLLSSVTGRRFHSIISASTSAQIQGALYCSTALPSFFSESGRQDIILFSGFMLYYNISSGRSNCTGIPSGVTAPLPLAHSEFIFPVMSVFPISVFRAAHFNDIFIAQKQIPVNKDTIRSFWIQVTHD
jgi:hypothetical protein